jgi:16S rRNA (uracil1498-N3)-methyltransferase
VRLSRVYVCAELRPGLEVALPDGAAAHLTRVLRLQVGDACVLFNGDGHDYPARISMLDKRAVHARVEAVVSVDNESSLRITLVQGIARGEKMDLILQKATELGVHAFMPVTSERSEIRLEGQRADKRLAHWRSVVIAACEQSGRAGIPQVAGSQPLHEAVAAPSVTSRWLLDPQAIRSIATLAAPITSACVLAVGPEGGWSARDRAVLQHAGFQGLRLGPRILRTETAGLAAVAALQSRFGDLG